MPVKFSSLKDEELTQLEVPTNAGPVTITYSPMSITGEMEEALHEDVKEQRGLKAMCRFVETVVVEWDLVGDEGAPYPLQMKALAKLPAWFLTKIVTAISDAQAPGKVSAGSSNGT